MPQTGGDRLVQGLDRSGVPPVIGVGIVVAGTDLVSFADRVVGVERIVDCVDIGEVTGACAGSRIGIGG